MTLRTKVLSIALLSSLVLGGECISAFGKDSGYTLTVHVRDPHFTRWAVGEWNSVLREETGGALSVEPSQASFKREQLRAGVLSGEIGIGQIFFTALYESAPSLQAFEAPFLFEDEGHVSRTVEDADVMQIASQELAARGFRLLGVGYNGGFIYILSGGEKLQRLEDFSALHIGDATTQHPSDTYLAAPSVTAELFDGLGAQVVEWPRVVAEDSL